MTSDADRRFDARCRRLEGEDHQDERPRRVPRYPEDAAQVVGFGLARSYGGSGGVVPLDEGMPAIEDAYASERDVVSPPRASLDDVPLRGLLRIMWAETRAGLRDAWRRLVSAVKDGV